mgnify:CR=1 FL=1
MALNTLREIFRASLRTPIKTSKLLITRLDDYANPFTLTYEHAIRHIWTLSPKSQLHFQLMLSGHSNKDISLLFGSSIQVIESQSTRIKATLGIGTSDKDYGIYIRVLSEIDHQEYEDRLGITADWAQRYDDGIRAEISEDDPGYRVIAFRRYRLASIEITPSI